MNIANKLTVLRMILIPIFLFFLSISDPLVANVWVSRWELVIWFSNWSLARLIAISIFAVASFTDFLDGYLARKHNLVTNFGKFLDPVADKLLVSSALIALIPITALPPWVVIIIIGRDIMMSAFRMIAISEGIVIAADKLGKIKTVLQMIMILYFMSVGSPYRTVDIMGFILICLVVILTVFSAIDYLVKNKHVLKLDDI